MVFVVEDNEWGIPVARIAAEATGTVEAAVAFAKESPTPDTADVLQHVCAEEDRIEAAVRTVLG
ncbi:hypothetical protein [Kocuria turfanensis]|uniref:Uncharacterized protein n=1 Tax=Kocuria turfanensis TaxID=388357 RepID=A0A512IBV2_9MICC|nr:hypothetical protein [Kocuria turfanensis]GEO95180.1 hypothetical protein KTU01_13030 [Kocuria turfanensis]